MATFNVTGSFEEGDGSPSAGEVRLIRRNYLFTSSGILAPTTITLALTSGEVSQAVRGVTAGDDPATWSYRVEVDLDGQEVQTGPLTLTADTDLADVMASWDDSLT